MPIWGKKQSVQNQISKQFYMYQLPALSPLVSGIVKSDIVKIKRWSLYIYIYIYIEIGENIERLYFHPYKPLPLLLPRKGIYPDKQVITKQV